MATLKTPNELRQTLSMALEREKILILDKIAEVLESDWDGEDPVTVHFDGQLPNEAIRRAVASTLSKKGWAVQWENNSSYQGACYNAYVNDLPKRRGE